MPQNTTKSVLSTLCLTPTNLVSFWSFVFIEQILKIRQIYVQIDEYLTSEFWENTFFRQMFKKYPVYFSNWEKYSDNGIWRMCIRQTSKKICFFHKSDFSKLCWNNEFYPSLTNPPLDSPNVSLSGHILVSSNSLHIQLYIDLWNKLHLGLHRLIFDMEKVLYWLILRFINYFHRNFAPNLRTKYEII